MKCKILRLLLRAIPACLFPSALLQGHLETCAYCRTIRESEEEFRAWLAADEGQDYPDIQPQVMKQIRSHHGKARPIPERHRQRKAWAAALSCALLLLLSLFLLEKKWEKAILVEPQTEAREAFALVNVKMDGKPATPYIYRLKEQKMIIVWCERSREKSIN